MTAFIRHLRAAWNFGRTLPYVSDADQADYWSELDAQWLHSMFATPTGRKFLIKMRNYAMLVAAQSVCDASNALYRKDTAAGLFASIAAMEAFASYGTGSNEEEAQNVAQFGQ